MDKDLNGRDLHVGDQVIFTKYQNEDLFKGKILNITDANIICEGRNLRFANNNPNYNYVSQARIQRRHSDWRIIKL